MDDAPFGVKRHLLGVPLHGTCLASSGFGPRLAYFFKAVGVTCVVQRPFLSFAVFSKFSFSSSCCVCEA